MPAGVLVISSKDARDKNEAPHYCARVSHVSEALTRGRGGATAVSFLTKLQYYSVNSITGSIRPFPTMDGSLPI